MKRCILVLAFAAACGGDANAPHKALRPTALAVVSGDAQVDTVLGTLPDPVVVVATAGPSGSMSISSRSASSAGTGVPVPNQPINFRVVEPGCGAPVNGSAITNAQGEAEARWTLGQSAGLCHMEARAVDQATGAAIVFDTAIANVVPSVAATFVFDASAALPLPELAPAGLTFPVGKSFAFRYYMTDRFGNATTRIPGADEETAIANFEPTLLRLDSVVHMRAAGARHGYAAGNGWMYFSGKAPGTVTIDPTTFLAGQVKPGQRATVTITP